MDSCTFGDFMETLKPWLNSDYIRRAHFKGNNEFLLMFVDGGQKKYQIDDCTEEKIHETVTLLQQNGVPVTR